MPKRKTIREVIVTIEDEHDEVQDYIVSDVEVYPAVPATLVDPPESEYIEFNWAWRKDDKLCRRVTDSGVLDRIDSALYKEFF